MALIDRYIIFTIEGEHYGLPFKNFREVIPKLESVPVPFSHKCVKGIANLRGQIITVIDLYSLFCIGDKTIPDEYPTIVIEFNERLLALRVDAVECVVHLPTEKIEPPPIFNNSKLNNFSEAITRHERQLIVILSSEKLFSFEENMMPSAESNSSAAA